MANGMANGTSLSPAGSALFGDAPINNESEEERRKRLAALAQSQNRLTGTVSPATQALLGYGAMSGGSGLGF
jgi:hypothetical protein